MNCDVNKRIKAIWCHYYKKVWMPYHCYVHPHFMIMLLCILTSKHLCMLINDEKCLKIVKNTFFIFHTRGSCRKMKQVCLSAIGCDSQKLVDTQKLVAPGEFDFFDRFQLVYYMSLWCAWSKMLIFEQNPINLTLCSLRAHYMFMIKTDKIVFVHVHEMFLISSM